MARKTKYDTYGDDVKATAVALGEVVSLADHIQGATRDQIVRMLAHYLMRAW